MATERFIGEHINPVQTNRVKSNSSLAQYSEHHTISSKNKLLEMAIKTTAGPTAMPMPTESKATNKYKSLGGVDGSQFRPPPSKLAESQATSQSRGWNPLHFPKHQKDSVSPRGKPANAHSKSAFKSKKVTERPLHRDERIKRKRMT